MLWDRLTTGNIDAHETEQGHFSGFDEPNDGTRNKAEVMKDIIAKSKLAKYERQKAKDQDDEMRMELDEELGDIRSLLFQRPQKEEGEEPEEPPKSTADEKSEAYDAFVREMAFERRAKPQDRLKSAEELAEEQAKRLREAEAARQRRMHGEEVVEEEDDEEGEEDDEAPAKRRLVEGSSGEKRSVRSAMGLGASLDAQFEPRFDMDDEEEEEDDEDDEEDDEDGEEDEEDDEDEDEDEEDDEEDDGLSKFERQHLRDTPAEDTAPGYGRSLPKRDEVPTLPFTFPCPTSHDAFLDILEEHQVQPSQLNTVISRIRTLHAPNLDEKNPERLQRFLGVLVDHLLYRASQGARGVHDNGSPSADFGVLNDLVLHIAELSKTYPARAAEHFVAKLAMMQRNLTRGLGRGPLELSSLTWPALPELCLLRTAGLVWPTSDRWHPVATPLSLLMAQYLAHARIRSLEDMASGMYLCTLLASNQRASKRLMPEALNALYSITAILLPSLKTSGTSPAKALAEEYGIPTPDVGAAHTAHLAVTEDATPSTPLRLATLLSGSHNDAQTRADLLHLALALQERLASLYQSSPGFVELFTPLAFLLEVGASRLRGSMPTLASLVSTTAAKLRAQLERAVENRRALRLQAHRALSIASYAPKFDQQAFDPKRATDPDTERAQTAKLRALLKKERKGAIRELRKDAQFLAEAREQARVEEDVSYKRKIDKITSGLQEERSEQKQLDRAKAVLKKRAGKK